MKFEVGKKYRSNQNELWIVKNKTDVGVTLESSRGSGHLPPMIRKIRIEINETGDEFVRVDFRHGNHILTAKGEGNLKGVE